MPEAFPFPSDPRTKKGTLRRAARIAGAQWGVIGVQQLADCGISPSTARNWTAEGRLHRIHPGVYAYGHPSVPIEGRLTAALLHAGAGAVLSHATAAWWWGLIPDQPQVVEVSTKSNSRPVPGVRVHRRRSVESTRHRRFPVTTVAQTLLDLSPRLPLNKLRFVLAEADYRRLLNPQEVSAMLGRGRAGSTKLRKALARHEPRLALTREELERRFFLLCERAGVPLPEPNGRSSRMRIDAIWRAERVAVELDGRVGHSSPAQIERDRRRELRMRGQGLLVIRYTWSQVTDEPDLVEADVKRAVLSRTARSA